MRFSLFGLFRGIGLLALASTIAAVAVGKMTPRPANYRIFRGSTFSTVSGYHFTSSGRLARFLDPESGRLVRAQFPQGEDIDCAAYSPWEDGQGGAQVVARWTSRRTDGLCDGYGLARYRFPGGQVIDHVELETVPTSSPCFYPGDPDRLLFGSGDGKLYRFTFPSSEGSWGVGDEDESRPKAITWRMKPPGDGIVMLSDPHWPTDPRFKGRLIVSLSYYDRALGLHVLRRPELWTLQLNDEGTEIVAADRLMKGEPPASFEGHSIAERMSTVSTSPNGDLSLAYLCQNAGQAGWDLRLAPLKVDHETGLPIFAPSEIRTLSENCLPILPAFSGDGRWVYSFPSPLRSLDKADRYSVVSAFERSPSFPAGLALKHGTDPRQ